MPSHKHLKGVATNFASTFLSRNNDIDGYWALGVIRMELEATEATVLTLDLLAGSGSPGLRCVALLVRRYREVLERLLTGVDIAVEELKSATVELDFDAGDRDADDVVPQIWGEPFTCTVRLIGLWGVERRRMVTGSCAAHDSSRERRSIRREPYRYFAE